MSAVGAIVVHYGSTEDTRACVQSLMRQTVSVEVWVVDNDPAGRLELPRGTRHLPNAENVGFGAACNRGIREALGQGLEFVFLVNNDAVCEADTVATLMSAFAPRDSLGIAGPRVLDREGRIWFEGGKIDWRRGLCIHPGIERVPTVLSPSTVEPCDFISGCAMMVRASVFRAVGLLDPSYFLYLEDVDFNLRARAAGFEVRVVPEATVHHRGGASTGGVDSEVGWYFFTRNRLRFMEKHSRWHQWLYFVLFLHYHALRHWLRLQRQGQVSQARALRQGLRDFWWGAPSRALNGGPL
ncbi:MAG: glycosyltransferase family 2 protein [Acidobacteria bacterium]|nr:glycosyltransferase family 2 protein [Acidobacteriota bacterium]